MNTRESFLKYSLFATFNCSPNVLFKTVNSSISLPSRQFLKKKKKNEKKRNTVGANCTSVVVFPVNGTAVYIQCDHQIHFPN